MVNRGFELFNLILNTQDINIKELALSTLSSLVRGDYLQVKREFLDAEGLQFCFKILEEYPSNLKMRMKVLNIFKDLLSYDDKLD